jgi:hypothetical protein
MARDPAFTLLPVTDRQDRTVAWLLRTAAGADDASTVLERLAEADDLARLGGGRPVLVAMHPEAVPSVLSRSLRPGTIVPLVAVGAADRLPPAVLRRSATPSPAPASPPSVGVVVDEADPAPPRIWQRAWCVSMSGAPALVSRVAASGVVPVLPSGDERASRRLALRPAGAHAWGPPLPAAGRRADGAVQRLVALLERFIRFTEGRAGVSELEALADDDPEVARELAHAVSTAGHGARATSAGAAATLAMRVLGRDPITQRLGVLVARRAAEVAGVPELAVLLLVRAALTRACVPGDPRGLQPPVAFAAGVVSLLDVALAQPVDVWIGRLGASDPLRRAVCDREGAIGEALETADALANGWWADVARRRPLDGAGAVVREAWRSARRDLAALRSA